jgi:DNA-binding MarR family transcriptional regulator
MTSLWHLLERNTRAAVQYRQALSRRLELDETATAALLHLAQYSPLTLGEMGHLLVAPAAEVAAALEELEDRGFVAAHPDASIPRLRVYTLTEEGVERVRVCSQPLVDRLEAIVAELSDQERAAVLRYLTEITKITEGERDAKAHEVLEGLDPLS